MSGRTNIFFAVILLLCCPGPSRLHAQLLGDNATVTQIRQAVDELYNLDIDKAVEIVGILGQKYPGHPIYYLLRGMITYWDNYPLLPFSASRATFENDMFRCIELCENRTEAQNDPEFDMANLGARGMLLLFYADNDLSREVIPLASSTYRLIRKAFDYKDSYRDFYFFTGLYNYYREAYPDAHPVYKPLAVLFPRGDKEKGLLELQLAASDAIFLKAEALSFLSGINISFENNFTMAFQYTKKLYEMYPDNIQYFASYLKNLLLIKQYNEAEKLILTKGMSLKNEYLRSQLQIFLGIIYEKKYRDPGRARDLYEDGLRRALPMGAYANEYKAYAYFGLSRICGAEGDRHGKRVNYKAAMDLAAYKNVNFND